MISNSYKAILSTKLLLVIVICSHAQIEGLWLVTKVTVGNETKTPVAKWVNLKGDGTQTSGNGLLQHTKGSWRHDLKSMTLTLTTLNGPEDIFEPFQIKYKKNVMTWERMEEGEKVVVELERTNVLPEGPADKIVGLWDLQQVKKNEADITSEWDAANKEYVFIRWDRIYVKRSADGERRFGIWHIDGHSPVLELISQDRKNENEKWDISFTDSKMIWKGLSESNKNITMMYQQIHQFPE